MEVKRRNKLILFSEIVVNVTGMLILFIIIWFMFYRYNLSTFLYKKGTAILFFIYTFLYFVFASIYGGHKIGHARVSEIIYSQFLSIVIVNVVTFLQICLIDRIVVRIKPMVLLTVLDTIYIVVWAYITNRRFQKRNIVSKMAIIYGGSIPHDLIRKMKCYDYKFKISKVVNAENGFDAVIKEVGASYDIVLCHLESEMQKKMLKHCYENSIPAYILPNTPEIILRGASIINLLDTPLLQLNNGELSLVDEFIKRSFDIAVSFLALVVLSPVMLLVALAIKLNDGGPILYKQKRLTINGKPFEVYKFRSMVVDAEKDGVARLARKSDNRITPVGMFIRRVRLDEIPQLFNILKGEMSLVGPRPERPEIMEEYQKDIPEFSYRLRVKAGLTGYAQVLGRYNTTPYDKLMWDLMYIESYSFFLDLKLILMTVKILFMLESTEGIEHNERLANKKKHNEY